MPTVMRIVVVLAANAIGLLLAAIALDKVSIGWAPFLIAVAIFTVVELIAFPILRSLSEKYADGLSIFVALAVTYLGLLVTDVISDGLDIEGVLTWILATLIVWAITAIAELILRKVLVKEPARS
jgi:uncharacterized membrane protein YvlD (DUF360 family)